MQNIKSKFCFLLISFVVLLSAACRKNITAAEFIDTVNKEGKYAKEQKPQGFVVHCTYLPDTYLALMELKKRNVPIDIKMLEKEKSNFRGVYFNYTIGLESKENIVLKGLSNQGDYAARVSELTYNLSRDFYLVGDGKDTISCLGYNFLNLYGVGNDAKFQIVFPEKVKEKYSKVELVYNDKVFGIESPIKFSYPLQRINKNIPTITNF